MCETQENRTYYGIYNVPTRKLKLVIASMLCIYITLSLRCLMTPIFLLIDQSLYKKNEHWKLTKTMVFITALFKNGPSWLPEVLKERVLDDSLLERTFSTVIIYLMGPFKLNFITAFSFQCVLPENIHTPLSPWFSVWRGYSDLPPWNFLGCDVALRPPIPGNSDSDRTTMYFEFHS